MKELIRKIVRKVVLFGVRDILHEMDELSENNYQKLEQVLTEQANRLSEQANLISEHSNSIQYFAETLAEKSFLIGCNASEIKRQVVEIKKIQIQLKEATNKEEICESRIFQIVPVFKSGDAIGNYALFIKSVMDNYGLPSEIYCYENLSDLKEIKNIEEFPVTNSKDAILLHMAAENEFAEIMEAYSAKKVLFYHNITPSHFFDGFDDFAEQSTKRGRIQVDTLKQTVDACITVSEYNKAELQDMGYNVPIHVVPIPFKKEDYTGIESEQVKAMLTDGKKNILFVGRIAPNKKMEDLIESYQTYYDGYDKNVRLILLGNYNTNDKYYNYLKEKIRPGDDIIFTGHIKNEEWITYYKYADLFLCLSEHEGFCVPLVEAMSYQIPIVAYDSSAVGETLGQAGILLKGKNPNVVAKAIHQIFNDKEYVDEIRNKQQERMHTFDSKLVAENLKNIVKKIVED